ncbi:ATP-dependent DNA ligase [Pasteurellaceae bacterium LFhippo2]|nr:ATP-dependent DNA ligase [Pasteurellaceae bacterium LFhippo2]
MWRLFLFLLLSISTLSAKPLNLMLLEQYKDQNIDGWVMSEKLDGVRGFWDGKQLLSRQGYPLTPPDYFVQGFPPFAIDGELFSERNKFDEISATVRANKKGWHKLKLYVFDVPNAEGNLFERLAVLKQYLEQNPTPYIEIIEQIPVKNKEHLNQFFSQIQSLKGEGVVIRNPNSPYIEGRSAQILKYKTILDEECRVVAHHKGKGKYADKLGAITCENHRGQFRIGSGFKDKDRENPPPINALITYKYRGLTSTGKPRFATFWRIRSDVIEEIH